MDHPDSTIDKTIAWLTLLNGLSISSVAIYFSIIGLISIFPGDTIPIILMGCVIEISKLSITIWIKRHWDTASGLIKTASITAILILMFFTSMGIFGFLSRSHIEHDTGTSEFSAKVQILDDKIATQKENILTAKKALSQMDMVIDQTLSRTTNEQGTSTAVALRRMQAKERNLLNNEITTAQAQIAKLMDEKEPLSKQVRLSNAEVGPIKYIAALVYGDKMDDGVLESAVRWVIILIVSVFDPLAVMLLILSQISFQRIREARLPPPMMIPVTIHHEPPTPAPVTFDYSPTWSSVREKQPKLFDEETTVETVEVEEPIHMPLDTEDESTVTAWAEPTWIDASRPNEDSPLQNRKGAVPSHGIRKRS